ARDGRRSDARAMASDPRDQLTKARPPPAGRGPAHRTGPSTPNGVEGPALWSFCLAQPCSTCVPPASSSCLPCLVELPAMVTAMMMIAITPSRPPTNGTIGSSVHELRIADSFAVGLGVAAPRTD